MSIKAWIFRAALSFYDIKFEDMLGLKWVLNAYNWQVLKPKKALVMTLCKVLNQIFNSFNIECTLISYICYFDVKVILLGSFEKK